MLRQKLALQLKIQKDMIDDLSANNKELVENVSYEDKQRDQNENELLLVLDLHCGA